MIFNYEKIISVLAVAAAVCSVLSSCSKTTPTPSAPNSLVGLSYVATENLDQLGLDNYNQARVAFSESEVKIYGSKDGVEVKDPLDTYAYKYDNSTFKISIIEISGDELTNGFVDANGITLAGDWKVIRFTLQK